MILYNPANTKAVPSLQFARGWLTRLNNKTAVIWKQHFFPDLFSPLCGGRRHFTDYSLFNRCCCCCCCKHSTYEQASPGTFLCDTVLLSGASSFLLLLFHRGHFCLAPLSAGNQCLLFFLRVRTCMLKSENQGAWVRANDIYNGCEYRNAAKRWRMYTATFTIISTPNRA